MVCRIQTVLPRSQATERNHSGVFAPHEWGRGPSEGRDSRW